MKRFYREVHVDRRQNGWQVRLDERALKTASGAPQIVPSRDLCEALADEWRTQDVQIDPATFGLRDMADYAIDRVMPDPEPSIDKLLAFAETDTLCYRADEGDALRKRQEEAWEPLLTDAETRYTIEFARTGGIVHKQQPAETIRLLRSHLASYDPFALTGLLNLAGLACSLVIALAAIRDGADTEELWAAANLEEDWQAVQWGWDSEALENRGRRLAGFALAKRFTDLALQEA